MKKNRIVNNTSWGSTVVKHSSHLTRVEDQSQLQQLAPGERIKAKSMVSTPNFGGTVVEHLHHDLKVKGWSLVGASILRILSPASRLAPVDCTIKVLWS
jgi:hypothetical protein